MSLRSSDLALVAASPVFRAERAALDAGRGSHAYLLTGPAGIGKHSFALLCACTLVCREENAPCLDCAACRKVLSGNHPDVHEQEPEKNIFRVNQVRDMISTLYESPYEGGAKVYILKDFHKANEQAQNALLKTLEEPPRAVTIFLLAENPYALLPTVRSRCKTLRMARFDEAAVALALRERFGENEGIAYAAHASDGIIGRAIRLLNDEDAMRREKTAEALAGGNMTEPQAAEMLEKESLDELLEALEYRLVVRMENEPDARSLARLKAVRDARGQKNKNVNNGLLIELLAARLVKGNSTWQR